MRRQEAAIRRFEYVLDTGKTTLRQPGRIDPALRGTPGMKALHHRAFLRGHQPARLRADNAEAVQGLVRIESQHAGGGRRGVVPGVQDGRHGG